MQRPSSVTITHAPELEDADLWAETRRQIRDRLAAGDLLLDEFATRSVLSLGPIRFGPEISVLSSAEAASAAAEFGFPVVLKANVPSVVHKSDLSLVRVGLADRAAVVAAGADILNRVRDKGGVQAPKLSVQRQLAGVEVVVGIRRDPLGPMCAFGAGGTLVELLRDVVVLPAPCTRQQVKDELATLRLWSLLTGYRGRPPAKIESLVDLIVNVSELAVSVPEISELDLNPVFVSDGEALVADARMFLAVPSEPAAPRRAQPDLRPLFRPRRIAVIGSVANPKSLGGLLARYLRSNGFEGDLVAVNPKGIGNADIRGFHSLAEVPDSVDLACIMTPAESVEGAVSACISARVPVGIVFSAGFAESGPDGDALQSRIKAVAGDRFRFVGPNTIGIGSPVNRLFATFGMAMESANVAPGKVGFVSQSGAIASSMVSRSYEFDLAFSHWISTGNEADLDVVDFVQHLVDDPQTSVIALFLEVIRRPNDFAEACRAAIAAGKAVVAFKSGRSEAGRLAAASHTGAIAGSDASYGAFLKDCGVIRVGHLSELFTASQGLLLAGGLAGNRAAIITMSGGIASLLADACSEAGFQVPDLPGDVKMSLREIVPRFGGVSNPIDVTAEGITRPEMMREVIRLVRSSGAVDVVLIQLTTNADPGASQMAADIIEAQRSPGPPMLIARLGSPALAPVAVKAYRDAGLHVFTWPESLVQAAAACLAFGRMTRRNLRAG